MAIKRDWVKKKPQIAQTAGHNYPTAPCRSEALAQIRTKAPTDDGQPHFPTAPPRKQVSVTLPHRRHTYRVANGVTATRKHSGGGGKR